MYELLGAVHFLLTFFNEYLIKTEYLNIFAFKIFFVAKIFYINLRYVGSYVRPLRGILIMLTSC